MCAITFGVHRTCAKCGEPFEPRYEGQRKCAFCAIYRTSEKGYIHMSARSNQSGSAFRKSSNTVDRPALNAKAAATNFWEAHTPEGRNWVSSQDKLDMVRGQMIFDIKNVSEGVGSYGPQWIVDILIEGEECAISFAKNDIRNTFFEDLRTQVNTYGPTPAKLTRFRTTNGQHAFALANPDLVTNASLEDDESDVLAYRPDGSPIYAGDADAPDGGEVPF